MKARWTPPTSNRIKINFDGSVWQDGSTTYGHICRDDKGEVTHVGAKRGMDASPLLTEALALQFACTEASRLGFTHIHLEGDNCIVIDAVQGLGRDIWEIDIIVADIRNVLACLQEVLISHVYREANSAADKVADLAHLFPVADIPAHPDFVATVRKDAIGR